ncbi:MAG TPA: hypothetical protein VGJ71_10720 [Candidatus Limnocylindrales bacterium]|jgi:hypothetical protein
MGSWKDRFRAAVRGRRGSPDEVYADLRSMALTIDPATLQRPSGEPWSGALVAMMEIGLPSGTATFVALADGTASMYTSSGGGVIGAGEHAAVRAAADRFRAVLAEARGDLEPTTEFPGPTPGHVRFQLRTEDGGYTGAAAESALASGRHPLSESYAAGQDLITEIRLVSPA